MEFIIIFMTWISPRLIRFTGFYFIPMYARECEVFLFWFVSY